MVLKGVFFKWNEEMNRCFNCNILLFEIGYEKKSNEFYFASGANDLFATRASTFLKCLQKDKSISVTGSANTEKNDKNLGGKVDVKVN